MAKTFSTADLDAMEQQTFTSADLDAMDESRPGLLGRAAKGLWNAAVAGSVQAVRTQSGVGAMGHGCDGTAGPNPAGQVRTAVVGAGYRG